MKRRALLKYTAYITGYAVAAPLTSAILSGCKAEPSSATSSFSPAFFSADEYQNVAAMVEAMLPPTDTPGANEVGVPQFVDRVLAEYTEAEDAAKIKNGLTVWTKAIAQKSGKSYHELAATEQLQLLNTLDTEAREKRMTQEKEAMDNFKSGAQKFTSVDSGVEGPWWLSLKELAIGGYYSSEKIGMDVLVYDPVPGPYQGCISLEEVGKAYSL